MIGWLIYDQEEGVRNQAYVARYFAAAKKRRVSLSLLETEKLCFGFRGGEPFFAYEGKPIAPPDFAIVRTLFPTLSRQLEQAGVAVYNSSKMAELCNDKQKTYQFFASKGIPILDTYFAAKTKAEYLTLPTPFVGKPAGGRGGRQVELIETPQDFSALQRTFPHEAFLVQEPAFYPGKDLRVYVLGKKIVAAMLRTAKQGILSNYTLGGTASVYSLSPKEEQLVQEINSFLDPGLFGIDFLFHEQGLVLNEIEDVVGARMLYAHTNIDLADRYLDWIVKSDKT